MPALAVAFVAAVVGYALGCFSTGYYLVRLRTGQDLRAVGSGATGGRNAGRVLGRVGFLLTGAGDLTKSALAVLIPLALGLGPLAVAGAMIGVTAGHIWPIQLGFRGGRGVAPFVGTTALVAPVALAIGALLAGLFAVLSRRPNLGGLAGFVVTPFAALALGASPAIAAGCLVSLMLGAIGHRSYLREELATLGDRSLPRWSARGGSGDG